MRTPDWFHDEHQSREIESVALRIGDSAALRQLRNLARGLEDGWGERQVQNHLKRQPHLLLGRHRTGHGTFAFYESQLGSQYKIDWAVANGSSAGLSWDLIELESPLKVPFRRDGQLSAASRCGVEQIQSWRRWLKTNVDYAQRPKARGGLGLHEIAYNIGLVVVGRRVHYDAAPGRAAFDQVRNDLKLENLIEIVSYDQFLEDLKFRFEVQSHARRQFHVSVGIRRVRHS